MIPILPTQEVQKSNGALIYSKVILDSLIECKQPLVPTLFRNKSVSMAQKYQSILILNKRMPKKIS